MLKDSLSSIHNHFTQAYLRKDCGWISDGGDGYSPAKGFKAAGWFFCESAQKLPRKASTKDTVLIINIFDQQKIQK